MMIAMEGASMQKIDMTAMNQSLRNLGAACEQIGKAANEAAANINRFTIELHDRMNAAESLRALRGMEHASSPERRGSDV
jgi:hypothetical protein